MPKVVITGAGGFVGGHLVNHFAMQGWDVVAVFHRETGESFKQTSKRQTQRNELQMRIEPKYHRQLTFFDGDITHIEDMRLLFRETKPDSLVHVAALLIAPNESDYKEAAQYQQAVHRFIETNQSKVLADCAAEYQKTKPSLYCLLVSTAYVFDLKVAKINEETNHQPANLYPKSKEEAQLYWGSKGLRLGIIYPPQIYGPYQFTPALMPKIIRKGLFNEGDVLKLSGSVNPIHINNLARLIFCLCLTTTPGPFCIAGDKPFTFADIAKTLQESTQKILNRYQKVAYEAFTVIDNSNKCSIPPTDDTRITSIAKQSLAIENPHALINFSETADQMTASHWRHQQKTNKLMGLNFFGMTFKECFKESDCFTDDLRKVSETNNPSIIPDIELVYVLSGRTTVLGKGVDGLSREFDFSDDLARLYKGVQIARKISALRANKKVGDLTRADCVIPIFYNGRAIQNQHLKLALQRGVFNYPSDCFVIRAINPENTIGQVKSFKKFLAYEVNKALLVAVVTSAYHTPRVGRTIGCESPQVTSNEEEKNLLGQCQFLVFGVHKKEKRCGVFFDVKGEQDAMKNYSSGLNPTISRHTSRNIFFTSAEVIMHNSFLGIKQWGYRKALTSKSVEEGVFDRRSTNSIS